MPGRSRPQGCLYAWAQFALVCSRAVALARPTTDRADVPVPYDELHALCAMAVDVDKPGISDRDALLLPTPS